MITIYDKKLGIEITKDKDWVMEDYFDIDGVKRKRYYTHSAWAKRQARLQMKKRISKPDKPFVWRLGYNHCIGQFNQSDNYPTLSGSSLNRAKKPVKEKEEKEDPAPAKPHVFSPRSRGKVKDKATAFFQASENNRTFLTLTFIDDVSDAVGVGILNKFLTVLRKEKTQELQYLWVAEHQELNRKTIHFHILLNRRLPVKRYNALWVLQQYNAGLVGRKENGEVIDKKEIMQRYNHDMNSAFRKKDPDGIMAVLNPFHIEKAYNIDGLSFYLTKYITKQQKNDEFGCLNWHCSRRVSKLFTKEVVSPSTFSYLLSFNNIKVDKKTGQCWTPKVLKKQFFTMVYVNNKYAPLTRLRQMETVNKWIMAEFDPDKLPMIDDMLYRRIVWKN